eukprot:jgi/Psemu1/243992/estExt_Genewise1.C_4080020
MTNDEFESDTSFSKGNRNANDGSGPATPHRSKRINLGTPANYYFKYMNSSKKSASNDLSIRKDEDEDNTGTISIPGFQIGGDNAKTETSFFSMAGSSTASEGSVDLLNKSTLSDTTELTASNFVLVTTSKQNMVQGIRELKARAQKKENVENGKDATEQAQSVPMKQRENATADNLKTTLSGHMPENDIEPPSSKVHQSQQEVPRKLQQQPMKSASPSLRSRISSSPASLRKFHENLKNSRMRRQQQREEDTKRRLSIEADNTIDSMNAQLEALTKHSSSNRKRLPPPFTQLSQESPSQESSLEVSSRQASPAASSTDATATINIADLDDLLGIEVPTRRGNQESTKKHISAVQHALNDENSTSSILAKDDTPALQANANEMEISSTPNRTSSFIENSRFGEESKIESKPCSLDVKTQYSSPSSTNASLKLRSASSNQRKRMTPSNLSSTPQRVVNPRSVFSPASNTRSAKKRRKLLEEEEKLHASSAISAVIITRNEPSKIGTCLFHKASTTENDSSIESESSGMVTGTQRDQGDGDSPIGNDDTASLGEIADIFGSNGTNSITSPDVEAGELYHYNSKETGYKAEYQETASITDINDLIKQGFPPSQEFSGRAEIEESLLSTDESRVSQDPGYDDAKQLENKNMHTVQETRHFLSSDDSNSSSALKEGNGSALKEIRETIADELGPVLEDNTSSISPQSNVLCTPPDTQEIASQSNLSSESQHSLHSTKEFPKSPIRLTPNNRKKLTPSKLGPTPRRVMNPMNPNSPARNTRNSLKSSRSLDSSGLNSVLGGEPSKDCAPAEDQPDSVGNEEVVRFGKRRQSLSLQPITRQVAEPLHFEDKPFKKLPSGILSSKKKPFSRRSVAFGSPEAAEYNIGSPSVSLTPMPKGRAKALFALPAKCGISLENEIHKNQTENQTNQYTEDELGMDVLIDKITVEQMNNSPKLSPIEKRKTDTDVFQVPSNMMSIQGNLCCEDRTVELESGMQLLLAKNMKELEKQHSLNTKHSPSVSPVECRDNSVELTDSESIASIHSKYEKYTADLVLPIDAQRLDFSHVSETSKRDYSSADVEDGKTVELEGNMLSLLHATCSKEGDTEQKSIPNNDNMEMSQSTGNLKSMNSNANVEDGKTVELEGNILSLLQATNSGDTEKESIAKNKMETSVDSASIANVEDDKTMELEGNMLSLLQATESGDNEKESIPNDNMEMRVDSASLMQFTGNLKSMSSIANVEDDKTMELEGNMLTLLQAACCKEGGTEQESIAKDKMEISVDAASLMINNDISQKFTGNLKSLSSNANVEGSKTVELEGNMSSLLQTTDAYKIKTGKDENALIDKDGMDADLSSSIVTEVRPQSPGSSNINEACRIDTRFDVTETSDVKVRRRKSLSSKSFTLDRIDQSQKAVCGEVERRTDLEGTAAASLISVVKDDPDFFSVIQNKIQCSGDSSDIQKSLKNLVQAGQTLIEYEWNSWLVTVLESFYGPLNDIPQIFANDETKLDEAFQHCKNMQIDISFMSDRKTKRARRKSLLRHQSLVTKLEVEIDNIEAQLSTIRSELEEIEREENDIFKATTDCQGIHQEAEFCDDLKSKAESSQKTFLSLRGLHSWSIGTISEQDLEFSTIGSCPHTHLKLLYKGTKFGKASTNLLSKSDATHLIAKSLHAYQGSIASFLEMATRRLMSMSSESNENGSIRISHHLQKYTWHIGRLDLVAKEFQVVQRRFNGKLCRNGAEGIFSFIVEFESEKSIIVADFTIEPVYPSFPVEVRLDLISGEQDLERVRRALVKNAKPGFGSLSRACDIIQSIVRGKGGVN